MSSFNPFKESTIT
jgi:hypothetical protein